jgi:hypothetical protein
LYWISGTTYGESPECIRRLGAGSSLTLDADNDGFSDAIEEAGGTDPLSAILIPVTGSLMTSQQFTDYGTNVLVDECFLQSVKVRKQKDGSDFLQATVYLPGTIDFSSTQFIEIGGIASKAQITSIKTGSNSPSDEYMHTGVILENGKARLKRGSFAKLNLTMSGNFKVLEGVVGNTFMADLSKLDKVPLQATQAKVLHLRLVVVSSSGLVAYSSAAIMRINDKGGSFKAKAPTISGRAGK